MKKTIIITVLLLSILIILISISVYLFIALITPLNVFSVILILVYYLILLVLFARKTNKYPLNSPKEFEFNANTFKTGLIYKNNYLVEFDKIGNGKWKLRDDKKSMIFDMYGYFFPKQYICTYFIRNIHYLVINRNNYPLIKFFKPLKLYPVKKYENMTIRFHYNNKVKDFIVIKNNKSRMNLIMRKIIESKYYVKLTISHPYDVRHCYTKMNEQIYNDADNFTLNRKIEHNDSKRE